MRVGASHLHFAGTPPPIMERALSRDRGFTMFCPTCGQELPAGSKFCPGCGEAIGASAAMSQPQAPAPDSAAPAPAPSTVSAASAPKRSKMPLILCGIVVVAVAVVAAVVVFTTGMLGGGGADKFPNGYFSMDGVIPFGFRVSGEEGEQAIELLSPYTGSEDEVLGSGTLIPDGSNSYGTIWRIENFEYAPDYSSSSGVESIRLQFPESIAEGDPTGTWYLEISESNDNVTYVVAQFFEDGTIQAVQSSVHAEAAERATSILDDALSAKDVYNGVYQQYPYTYETNLGFSSTLYVQDVPNGDPLIHMYYVEDQSGALYGIVNIQLDE